MSSILNSQNYLVNFCTYPSSGYLPSFKFLPSDETITNNGINYTTKDVPNLKIYKSEPDLIFFQDEKEIRWEVEHNLNSLCNSLDFFYINSVSTDKNQNGLISTSKYSNLSSILYFQKIENKNNICICNLEKNDTEYFFPININQKSIYGFNLYTSLFNKNVSFNINWFSSKITNENSFKCGYDLLKQSTHQNILFQTPFNNTNYVIFATLVTESLDAFYFFNITKKNVNGFDILLSNTLKSTSCYLNWVAFSLDSLENSKQGNVISIPINTSEITIPLTEEINENYNVFFSIENEIDNTQQMFLCEIIEKTSTSFTLKFSTEMKTSNYKLNWVTMLPLNSEDFTQEIIKILPKDIELVDENKARGYFTRPISGIVNMKKFGNIVDESEKYPSPHGSHNIFSPHYKVEIDINEEPLLPTSHTIISYDIEKSLYQEWEKFRPESRVAHYQILFKLYEDLKYGEINTITHYKNSPYTNWIHESILSYSVAPNTKVFSNIIDELKNWDIYHNFGTTSLIIQTFNTSLSKMLAKNIFHVNKNSINVEFEYPNSGYCFFVEAEIDKTFYIDEPDKIITLEHNFGTENIIIQLDDKFMNKECLPYKLTVDENKATFTFNGLLSITEPLYGNILAVHGDHVFYQNEPTSQWIIEHNSGYKAHIFQCFDEDGNEILPRYNDFINENLMTVTFSKPISGRIVLKYICTNPEKSEGAFLEKAKKEKLELRIGSSKDTLSTIRILSKINNIIKTQKITSIIEEKEYFILNFEIPISENYEIKQFGLYDNNDFLYYYSYGDLIYKLQGMNLLISYKIHRGQ